MQVVLERSDTSDIALYRCPTSTLLHALLHENGSGGRFLEREEDEESALRTKSGRDDAPDRPETRVRKAPCVSTHVLGGSPRRKGWDRHRRGSALEEKV
jgi:hypothetical protein